MYCLLPMLYEVKLKTQNPHFENVQDVEPTEVFENASQLTLIDVREQSEFNGDLGHIASATLIILHTIPDHLKSIPTDKPIVFVCRSGGRSAQACAFAQQQGLKNVYNMRGGMMLWNHFQLPITKE